MLEINGDDPFFYGIETMSVAEKFDAWSKKYLHQYQGSFSVVVVSFYIFLFKCF